MTRFVIHHLASSELYDVRLEIDGVLVSWAVPKGPSAVPRERRLAVRTEDRPIDLLDGTSTARNGSPSAWDSGTWENTSRFGDGRDEPVPAADAIDEGRLSFRIVGSKLRGDYTLQRFRDRDEWLLIKQDGVVQGTELEAGRVLDSITTA